MSGAQMVGLKTKWFQHRRLWTGHQCCRWPIEPISPAYRGEVAARYRYVDGAGEIGIIASITEPFCRDCHRARLSADGKLHTCLFSGLGWDVLGELRREGAGESLTNYIANIWGDRSDRYSDERAGRDRADKVCGEAGNELLRGVNCPSKVGG